MDSDKPKNQISGLRESMIELIGAQSDKEFDIAIQLFKEYSLQIGIDLSFQNFDKELIEIKQQYSRPNGIIIIAYGNDKNPMGCFGIRKFTESICELKRMYLKKEFRGLGFGQQLLTKAIEVGRELNYKAMRLDTLPNMTSAIRLYKKVGFCEINPYRFNPIEGTKYFEIQLEK